MSDLRTKLATLLGRDDQDYLDQFDDLMTEVVEQLLDVQAMLFASVSGTSTSDVAIDAGAKSLVLDDTDTKSFIAGQRINVSADSANYMIGVVDSWNPGTRTLSFTVGENDFGGNGSHASWTISLGGDQGPAAMFDEGQTILQAAAFTLR